MSDSPMALSVEGIRFGVSTQQILNGVDAHFPAGKVTAVLGPNGCGKSTLLRTMAKVIPATAGSITVGGHPAADFGRKEYATQVSLMAQRAMIPDGVTVAELVGRGRYPHQGWLSSWTAQDEQQVQRAMRLAKVEDLAPRPVADLSGGQIQRVWLALVLAQDTPVMLLDEPTTFLDIGAQHDLLSLVRSLADDQGKTVVAVLHDLQQAARFADHLVVMNAGRVVAQGPPKQALSAELVEELYGVPVEITTAGRDQHVVILPR